MKYSRALGAWFLVSVAACVPNGELQRHAPQKSLNETLSMEADNGDTEAMYLLALTRKYGIGVEQDDAQVAFYLRKAAERGHAIAQFELGLMHHMGKGVPRDYAEALRWYRMAAEQGDADAQFSLGVMYELGEGVPKDYVRAYMWLELASLGSEGERQKRAARYRDLIAKEMTRQQVSDARRLAQDWEPRHGE